MSCVIVFKSGHRAAFKLTKKTKIQTKTIKKFNMNLVFFFFHSVNTNECASNPCVNGNCTDGANGFMCNCEEGWSGETCNGK